VPHLDAVAVIPFDITLDLLAIFQYNNHQGLAVDLLSAGAAAFHRPWITGTGESVEPCPAYRVAAAPAGRGGRISLRGPDGITDAKVDGTPSVLAFTLGVRTSSRRTGMGEVSGIASILLSNGLDA
jgi:hypothetical protein